MPASREKQLCGASQAGTEVVYHEKQYLWRCGLHAVNALLQKRAFTAADFGEIADGLVVGSRMPWSHPHRSVLGIGDYDVNVLMCALEKTGLRAEWLSKKVALQSVIESTDDLKGFLVNVPSKLPSFLQSAEYFLGERRHWIAVTRYSSHFYLVDSKFAPTRFEDESDLVRYLEQVRKESGHILYVVSKPQQPSE